MAHVKYDMGEMGREEWNKTVSTRICIVIWSQRPQVEEKNAPPPFFCKESTYICFYKGFYSEWLAVWLLGSLTA